MKALHVTDNEQEKLKIVELPVPELQPGQALVKMTAAALNHRDQWIRENKYAGLKFPSIPGSDGCGIVEKVYSKQDAHWLGQEVIMNPNVNWGGEAAHQSARYSILGMPTDGTFAQYLAIDTHRLYKKPAHLSAVQAAALPLAGLTAYRAVFTQGQVAAGQQVLVSGIGGGVALFAFQFAQTAGASVYVTSGSEEKLQKATEMGAVMGVNYKVENWHKTLAAHSQGFHLIIDSAGGEGFNTLIRLLRMAGTLVFYGATQGVPSKVDLHRIFWYQLRLQGSTMGNDQEFADMIQFVEKHRLVPVIDSVRPFEEIITAFDEMKSAQQLGKLVVTF